jgi:uncharacterized protein YbjT (DUF2867 family)
VRNWRSQIDVKVAIAGGHGKIALRLARLLRERGDEALSVIRNPAHTDDVRAAGAVPVICDLEEADANELAAAVEGADAVVFAAGAGPGSGPRRKETVDYGGAVKLIEAAERGRIDRYVMVSSMRADPSVAGEDTFAVYLRAKGRADRELSNSGLDYTIIRPTRLTDDPGNGRVRIGHGLQRGSIPRDDVAAVVAGCLHEPATIGRTFDLTDGDEEIAGALARL